MVRILLTGAAGMVGSHLLERLAALGEHSVIGTFYRPTIRIEEIERRFELAELDVRYEAPVRAMIDTHRPQVIYHLAAQSLPTMSWANPWETMDVNVRGTINVFEAVKHVRTQDGAYDPMIVVACSSAQYGASLTADNMPVDEDAAFLPMHPYGVSKVAQDLLARQYWANDRIRCIRARIFNCTGSRKRADVVSDFSARVARIMLGDAPELRVGNLETRRAIMDVRDLVEALILLAERGEPGEAYNICGDTAHRIHELVEILQSLAGIPLVTRSDPALLRPSDEPIIAGRSERLRARTGWRQTLALKDTIRSVLDYERGLIAA